MTPNEIIHAYRAVQELSGAVFPFKLARDIARLKKRLSDEFSTVLAMERSLVEHYGGEVKGNNFVFSTSSAREAFTKHYENVMTQDDDSIPLPTVNLTGYTDGLRLSPDAVAALEGIVIFEEG